MRIKEQAPDGYASTPEAAKALGITANAIRKAVNAGRITSVITVGKRLFVNPVEAAKELKENRTAVGGDMITGRQKKQVPDHDDELSDTVSLVALRRRKLEIDNAKGVHELRRLNGLVVDKSEVEKRLFSIGQLFRTKMGQLPATVVDDVMAARTRNAAILVLEDAVNLVLNEIADEIEKGI
jgi:hypothetical protein